MTVILILACVAIGGAELYMARAARQTAERLEKLEAIAVLQDERIESVSARLRDGAPDLGNELKAGVHRIDAELTRITEESARLRDRLAELTDARGLDLKVHQKMIRTIESLEHTVGGVFAHTLSQLEGAVAGTLGEPAADRDTVRGIVCGGAASSHDALIRGFERCTAEAGLRVRFRVAGTTDPRHSRYYLTGQGPRELERDFLDLLACREAATPAETAFQELLRALQDIESGFAQIGPMVAVRMPDALRCGVLTLAECRALDTVALIGDPAAVAGRLAALPAERVRDLAEPPEPEPPEPEPAASRGAGEPQPER